MLVLVDNSWFAYRSFFAFKDFRVTLGYPSLGTEKVGQLIAYTKFVYSVVANYPKAEIVFCKDLFGCDQVGGLERDAVFAGYKEGREGNPEVFKDLPLVEKVLGLSPRVKYAEAPGKEADDLLALLAIQAKKEGKNVVVYTGDNDLLQLIPMGIIVSRKMERGKFLQISREYIDEKFGDVPINHLLRYRTIVGDPSDRIPPVVPRLNRVFVKEFCRVWHDKGLQEAFNTFALDDRCKKLFANREALVKNIKLMDLQRYALSTEHFPVRLYVPEGDPTLVEKYHLSTFQKHLDSLKESKPRNSP